MTLTDPFAPISPEEAAAVANASTKEGDEKTPIVPVPDDAPEMSFKHPAFGKPVRMWAYRDGAGRLLGYDARFEYVEEGARQKQVLPITYCKIGETGRCGWRSKHFPARRPLYGLDRLAARPRDPVVIAEGCKSADAAGELLPDHVHVSWPGGSNQSHMADWSALTGRNVLIWPDRDRHCFKDTGGEKPHADQVGMMVAVNIARRLVEIGATVQILDLEHFDCPDGWDAADALDQGWVPEQAAGFVRDRAVPFEVDGAGTALPHRYEYREDGLYYVEDDKDGSKSMRIAGLIKVAAKTSDQSGKDWGLLLEWRDYDGHQHTWAMPLEMLAGDGTAIRETFLSQGMYVASDPKARSRLNDFLSRVDTNARARAVSRVGWAGRAFALPEMTIGDAATDRVIFQHSEILQHFYQQSGTLKQWQDNVARYARGNSRLLFAISASLAGPILTPAGAEGGGFNYLGNSSTGKTTALYAAASSWGPNAYVRTWRATGNGLEGVATQHNETLLCLDELGQLDAREAGPTSYMLGNGQGKSRASRTGQSRPAATWKVLYLSSGEVALSDLVREAKPGRQAQAGQEVRFLDFPADADKGMGAWENLHGLEGGAAFSNFVKAQTRLYYGTAAPAFIREIVNVRDRVGDVGLSQMIDASIAAFERAHLPPNSDGQVERAARRFGLVSAAGELGIALGILPWEKGEAQAAAGVMMRAWIGRRGGIGSTEHRNILTAIRSFIERHGDSRFQSMEASEHERATINRAGFWRIRTGGEREYLFLSGPLKEEVCAGFDFDQVTNLLIERGICTLDGGGKKSHAVTLPDLGKTRVYIVGPELFRD